MCMVRLRQKISGNSSPQRPALMKMGGAKCTKVLFFRKYIKQGKKYLKILDMYPQIKPSQLHDAPSYVYVQGISIL